MPWDKTNCPVLPAILNGKWKDRREREGMLERGFYRRAGRDTGLKRPI